MKLIRLVTGEELIAQVSEFAECGNVVIDEAVMLIPAGEGKIGMIPFMPYSDGSPITIDKKHIMFMTKPNEELYRQVLKLTTGLETPSSKIVV